jgi:hypothetical protein
MSKPKRNAMTKIFALNPITPRRPFKIRGFKFMGSGWVGQGKEKVEKLTKSDREKPSLRTQVDSIHFAINATKAHSQYRLRKSPPGGAI